MCLANPCLEEEPQYVIEVCPDQQAEQKNHTGHLSVLHKLVARFTTGNHLIEEEARLDSF